MKTMISAILFASTTLAGSAYAESHAAASDEMKSEEMNNSATESAQETMTVGAETAEQAGSVDMEAHDAAVAAITDGNGDVTTTDDVVVGQAQRVQADAAGRLIALIRLTDELDTEITAIQAPLLVETEGEETVLRIDISQADLQTALDEQKAKMDEQKG